MRREMENERWRMRDEERDIWKKNGGVRDIWKKRAFFGARFAWTFLAKAASTGFFDASAFGSAYEAAADHVAKTHDLSPPALDVIRQLSALGARDEALGTALAGKVKPADAVEAMRLLQDWGSRRARGRLHLLFR